MDAKVGPLVPVVVAAKDIPSDEPLRSSDLHVERVPARYIPPDALGGVTGLAGARAAVPVAAGAYITAGLLQGAAAAGQGPLRPGERAVEVAVSAGVSTLDGSGAAVAGPGSRVDVLVSTQARDGAGRTFVAFENVALLDLRPLGGGGVAVDETMDQPAATAVATLRVTARQAVYLTAAETFAHEVRLLVRPPGDRSRTGPVAVSGGEL